MTDGVVLLHGIFRTKWSMRGLALFLERNGFRTLNINYPSTRYPLQELADRIHPGIERFAASLPGNIHFVGYSMGGLLIRAYLHKHRPERLGRVVLVATPNSGSEVADKLLHIWGYKKMYGPAGQQLVTDQEKFRHIFGESNYDFACIAGDRTLDPIGSWMIGKPNDGKVSVESSKLQGMKEHVVVHSDHTFIPSSRRMWRHTLQFLKTGTMAL